MLKEFNVPVNMGHILGNALRQVAIRGTVTWRVAGYCVPNRDMSYGISGDLHFSVMEFLKGTLEYNEKPTTDANKIIHMTKHGDEYVCEGFTLKNLGHLGVPSLSVFIVADSGRRTQQDNFDLLKSVVTTGYDSFVCIPTCHSETSQLSYTVEPKSVKEETLTIKSEESTLSDSLCRLSMVISTLQQDMCRS